MKQKTIKKSFSLKGVGIHSGKPNSLKISPANENSGIVLIKNNIRIPARIKNVASTQRGTNLKSGNVNILTVEHLLAAIFGLGIDNLEIDFDGIELPIMDGSARPYVKAFMQAGTIEQRAEKNPLIIKNDLEVKDGEAYIRIEPANSLQISFSGDFPVIGKQAHIYNESSDDFAENIAPARTFGYVDELENLQIRGLALGASIENALCVGKNGYENAPRFENEPARHKILDILGDMALLCRPIKGKISGFKCGHKLHIELARKLEEQYAA